MRRISCIFSFLLLSGLCAAVTPQFRFRHLTVDDGLPSNSINCLLQDQTGFLWICTANGLSRYDGIEMRNFVIDSSKPDVASVRTIYEDVEGNLWMGTNGGLYIYHPKTESFSLFMRNDTIPADSAVSKVVGNEKAVWYIDETSQKIYRYSLSSHKTYECPFSEGNAGLGDIYLDSYGTVWAIVRGRYNLFRWDEDASRFVPYLIDRKGLDNIYPTISLMYEDSNHAMWLVTWSQGLFKLNRSTHEMTPALMPSPKVGLNHIHYMAEWKPGILLIGSDEGLTLFNYESGETRLYISERDSYTSLSDEFIYPILKDREGGLWVGSYYGGVNYMPAGEKNFTGFAHSEYNNSVRGNVISRFCEGEKGEIWIASDDGGLNCYYPAKNQFTHFAPASKTNLNAHALCLDGDLLWVGTYDGGVYTLNTRSGGVLTPTLSDKSELRSVYDIFKAHDGTLWFGTMSNVLAYSKSKKDFIVKKRTGTTTLSIKEDLSGNIWFATQGAGLYKYNPVTKMWKNYRRSQEKNTLVNDVVNCIYQDEGGSLWIGTDNGMCRYLPEKDAFERIEVSWPGKSIYSIMEDSHRLWLTTSMGLVCYDLQGEYTCFTKEDGLQSNVFVGNSGLKASDGTMYAGTVNGFNTYRASEIHRNEYVPSIVFTGIELNNKRVEIGDESGVLEQSLANTKKLNLSYKDNMISISYAALSFSTPTRNQYAYMMKGFDTDWNYVGNQTKAIYSHLPPGKYIFMVKASNNDQVWNDTGISIEIVVHPPFYFNLFFRILYLLILLGGITYLVYYFHARTNRKHRRELQRMESDKEKEFNSARVDFFTTIAHEIRTPVSLISAPIEKILATGENLPASIKEDLLVIKRNSARLLFLVNQFLDFRRVEQSDITLTYSSVTVYEQLQATVDRFLPFFEQKGIHFTMECNDKKAVASVDSEALNIIVSNLLSNANKFTRDKIFLQCDFYPSKNLFEIVVADNGKGIDDEQKTKVFKPFYQIAGNHQQGTGIGLTIVKKYVDALGGSVTLISSQGKGASFTVSLPITPNPQAVSANPVIPQEEPATLPDAVKENIVHDSQTPHVKGDKTFLLIVEDNDEMLSFLTDSFSNDYIVSIAKDGKEALDILNENGEINLIISDLMMPNMNGIELCKAVRENMFICHIPFILLTAKTDMISKVDSMNTGVDVFIEKPFSIEYLKACAHNLIELRKMLWLKFMKMPLVPLNSVSVNRYDEDFLNNLNSIIEENFSNSEMSVEFLAEKLCISRSKLFVKIKNLTNCTPNELIQVVRLKKAAELLLENRYRINEICYMVGFNNHSYFSKCFQKQFGVKPQDFARTKKDEDATPPEGDEDSEQ